MKIKLLSLALLLITSGYTFATPPELKLPAEITGEAGDFIVIKAVTPGKKLSYKVVDKGLKLFPKELVSDPKTIVVTSIKPGKYRLHVVTAVGDELSDIVEVVIIISNGSPDKDPSPPLDELTLIFKKSYEAETAADKRERWAALTEAMRKAADMSGDTSYKSIADLISAIGRSTSSAVGSSLMSTRKVIGDQLNKTLPVDDLILTPELRSKIKEGYLRISSAMEAAK